jgi:hypothetical protein
MEKYLFTTLSPSLLLFSTGIAQGKAALTSLSALNQKAKQMVSESAFVPLADEKAEICQGADVLEAGRIPNFVRAMALLPNAAKPFAQTFKAYLYAGTIHLRFPWRTGAAIAPCIRSRGCAASASILKNLWPWPKMTPT